MSPGDYITPGIAAKKYLGISARSVTDMCVRRDFKTAHKPGHGRNAHWKILRTEVISHKFNSHITEH